MQQQRFVAVAKPRWDRLESLLTRLDAHGFGALDTAEIEELALGYRAVTSDLALARGRSYHPTVITYVNRLVARAHAYVYLGTSRSGWSATLHFLEITFPREVRRSWIPIGICAAITTISAIIAYLAVNSNPANAFALLPAGSIPQVSKALHDSNFGFDRAYAPLMSSQIITNNVRVVIMAFAGGMTAGLVTVWVILENGLLLGGMGALFARADFGLDFWATITPHGVFELSAIQIAGGAGLLLAAAIVAPGRVRRSDALVANARRAGTLLIGSAAMLVVAGTIEGFISPQRLGIPVRFAIGALTAGIFALYLLLAGREKAAAA